MSQQNATAERAALEPMDARIRSIQPGGGVCMRLELAWGSVRRWYLRNLRKSYVERMRAKRQGDPRGCPHEVLDPRDLKFFRNQSSCQWLPADNPFAWRERIPFARTGLAELWLLTTPFVGLALLFGWLWWPLALAPEIVALLIVCFFRYPPRTITLERGLVVAPADGRVVAIEEVDNDPFVGGPAICIGIFLSIFNVHINRVPVAARIIGLTYAPGKFLNALRPSSARENEQLAVRLEEALPPYRRMVVRQIAGAFARRIVCWLQPGDELARGAQFGMIKLGSRTELVLPRDGLTIDVRLGSKVKAGTTVLAHYND